MISIKTKGAAPIEATLRKLARNMPTEVHNATYAEATAMLQAAVARAPKTTGALRESAYVTPGPHVEFGFGAPYAVEVHERTDVHHRGGEAKFLQRAIDASSGGRLDRMAATLRPALEGRQVTTRRHFPEAPVSVPQHTPNQTRTQAARSALRRGKR